MIAFREMLISSGMSNTSITNRLSALSSRYKHLADKQLCKSNPVSGVRYPHKGHKGLGSGKTPTLTRKQVRAHLDAPDTSTIQGLRGCCQTNEPEHHYSFGYNFYKVTKERHSVRAALRLSLNVLRVESDLCELNRL